VPAMKLTFTAAMRARDVSRPRAEHLAAAEEAEAGTAGGARPRLSPGDAARPGRGGPETGMGEPGAATAGGERTGRAGFPRRRRGARDSTQRARRGR
jgi:hypothetical protein